MIFSAKEELHFSVILFRSQTKERYEVIVQKHRVLKVN